MSRHESNDLSRAWWGDRPWLRAARVGAEAKKRLESANSLVRSWQLPSSSFTNVRHHHQSRIAHCPIHICTLLGDGRRSQTTARVTMVKFYSNSYTYDYGFSAVSLAYFLRYPNPYSRHVASTDTIERHFDPETGRLTTVRLHLKRSRLPTAVLKLLPKSALGANDDGSTQSFILEKSVIDVKEGWMATDSRNLDWNNVLSVIEKHTYRRPEPLSVTGANEERTDVDVSVTLKSRIGEQIRKRRERWGQQANATSVTGAGDEEPVKPGFFQNWTSGAVRTAIESIGMQRTEKSQPKAQKGMSVVLARLREGGVQAVLEGMAKDRELAV